MGRTTVPSAPSLYGSTAQANDRKPFHSTIRGSDVFLCSYPKSGTTWLGFLIAHVLKKDQDEQLDLRSFNRYVPDVNPQYRNGGSLAQFADFLDPRFLICNTAYDRLLPRVIYVVRDPRDTMVSYWHYRKFLEKDFKVSLGEFLKGNDHWPCEWDEHVAGWMLPNQPRTHVVRYEDLHKDTAAVLRSVLAFAQVSYTEARLDAAVEASRFEKMRAAEEKSGGKDKTGDEYERLVRRGRVGNWQEEMGYAELRILEEKYGKVMRAVGYEPLS